MSALRCVILCLLHLLLLIHTAECLRIDLRGIGRRIAVSVATIAVVLMDTQLNYNHHHDVAIANDVTNITPTKLYGLNNGRLLPCKLKSNCISTSSVNSVVKYSRPWLYTKPLADEFNEIVDVMNKNPYLKVVTVDESLHYIRAEAKSAFPPSGIDDIELLLNDNDKIITYRSNSRETVIAGTEIVGDAGANRNRLNDLKSKLRLDEMGAYEETDNYIKTQDSRNIFDRLLEASKPSEINFIDNSTADQ